MRLATWLKKNNLSDAEFGRRIGVHRTRVWKWRTGRELPRADAVAAIERITGESVKAKDFSRAA